MLGVNLIGLHRKILNEINPREDWSNIKIKQPPSPPKKGKTICLEHKFN